MARMTERLDVRISQAERDRTIATARSLGLSTSRYVRTALSERSDLEEMLAKRNQEDGETE